MNKTFIVLLHDLNDEERQAVFGALKTLARREQVDMRPHHVALSRAELMTFCLHIPEQDFDALLVTYKGNVPVFVIHSCETEVIARLRGEYERYVANELKKPEGQRRWLILHMPTTEKQFEHCKRVFATKL